MENDLDYLLEKGIKFDYNKRAKILIIYKDSLVDFNSEYGKVGLLTAGTSDIPIAEEAKVIVEQGGCEVISSYDIGVAGIHRLFPQIAHMVEEDVCAFIVCAGMEGALPSVVAGLVDVPVIAVPTSVGYGIGADGKAALYSMLQSCAPGLAVVNIDNGFGAGVCALTIAKNIAKNVSGYNLTSLFVGSEGTLGLITKITLKLIPKPQTRLLTLCYFDNLIDATKCVNNIINSGFMPSTIDLLDKTTIQTIEKFNPCNLLIDKEAVLLIELDGFKQCVLEELKILESILKDSNASKIIQAKNDEKNENIWKTRRSAFSALTQLKPNVITEDIVVPKSKIVDFVYKIQELSKKYNIIAATMGHAGDGNIHPNFALDLNNKAEKENFEKLKDELFYYAISIGATLSGEHGIGTQKKKYLEAVLNKNAHNKMKEIKKIFDSKNILNPGKSI